MTSRERTNKAIEFDFPDRIPLAQTPDADIACVNYGKAQGFVPIKPGMSEWGCVWKSLHPEAGDQGQVIEHPLSDFGNIDHYQFPDPFAPGRMDGIQAQVDTLHSEGRFVFASLGKGPMHLLDDLRGFESYLSDLLTEPERIELLLDGIFMFLTGLTEQFGHLGVDAVIFYDDQAMQSGPLFSMDIWKQRFKPRYQRLFSLAHEQGCKVCMHACGDLSLHLPELVDAGVDIIDNKQPALWMNSPAVDAVRGHVCFSTCLDIQSVMGSIDPESIEKEVSRLVRRLSVPGGGFMGTCYPKSGLGIAPEKNTRMIEAFRTFRWDE